ncbi:hypothetical protein CMI38_04245 [Candidatus Pacearchaeota archaeon]|jgi:predicted nucleotidyltransferase|nr:hypothetical protein [Candidatus Pacearchaeota archaeon]|tara:strand:+ start:986 stop:1555 length:570 start_codon:yes stop_codon:yes gene_type:complete
MVNIYKPKFTLLQQEILRYLFAKTDITFNARTLAIKLNKTQAGIIKALPLLEKENLIKIKKDKESKRWSISLNKDNQKSINLKRIENLRIIYESNLAEYLRETFPGTTIILFGSYSRGEDIWTDNENGHQSDIDITIIGTKQKNINLSRFEKIIERKISINFYKSFKEIHKNLKENILAGILISGNIEL